MGYLSRVLTTIGMLVFMIGALTACNTTEGLGQDVEAAGDAIEEAAEETEEELED